MVKIVSLNDPCISDYRKLKDRELARESDRFIAEGEYIVRRLLASDYACESVFLEERREAEMAPIVPPGVPVYVAPTEIYRQIVGYKFNSGILAVGRRKPHVTLDNLPALSNQTCTLVICPEIASVANMGSLIRTSAAFGVDAMILGERCCDPFWRQSIRVSMGTIFSIPLIRSDNLLKDLSRLRERWGFELAATVLDKDAEPLERATRRRRFGLLFGNEAQGLDAHYIQLCDRKLTIQMRSGIDSLNIVVSAGIFLHHFAVPAPVRG